MMRMSREPSRLPAGLCSWCGQEVHNPRSRLFCRGHGLRWINFWFGRVPGYVIVVFARDLFRCVLCGYEATWVKLLPLIPLNAWPGGIRQQLHVDHIRPISLGGTHSLDNMRTLCARCNLARGDRDENWEPKAARQDKAKLQAWVEAGKR